MTTYTAFHPSNFLLDFQLIISLIILVISFVVATLCIGLIIFLTRRIQKANRNQADSLVRETSTSSNNMKLKYARHSPIHTYQNATLDYTSNEGEVDSKTTGVIFVNNGNSSNLTLQDEDTISDGEKKPLLKDYEKSQETSDYVSEDAGLWFRDLSRKHLIRFLILLILLVFSSLVVRKSCRNCLSVSVCPAICLSVCLPIQLSVSLFVSLSSYLSLCLSPCPTVCLSVCLPVHVCVTI